MLGIAATSIAPESCVHERVVTLLFFPFSPNEHKVGIDHRKELINYKGLPEYQKK